MTVFVFDFTNKSPEEVRNWLPITDILFIMYVMQLSQVKLAQSAHLRLKTLRHPNILKYIDGVEVLQL